MRKICILFTFLFFGTIILNAQVNQLWRKYKHEVFFGVGASNFLGELGGANATGAHVINDFDFRASRYVFHGGYAYRFAERWSIGATLAYAKIYGDDKFTTEPSRSARDLHFKSPLIELSSLIYFFPLTERYSMSYNVGQKGRGMIRPRIYLFTGVSGLWFNPKAKYIDGNWYALQPLGTEGQQLKDANGNSVIPSRKPYSRITMAIPIGIGLDYPLTQKFLIGFEFGFRYTFSDYLDDVSTSYVDKNLFDDPIAAYFSDPTRGEWNGSGPGQQRGQSNVNDTYMFFSITAKYKLSGKRLYVPKF